MEDFISSVTKNAKVGEELKRLRGVDPSMIDLTCEDWLEKLKSNENYKLWCDEEAESPLADSRPVNDIYNVHTCHFGKNLRLLIVGTFMYQRPVLKQGSKKKDADRMEYMNNCPAMEHIKAKVAEKMKCAPMNMVRLFLPTCYNQCSLCRRAPKLPKSNKFCLRSIRMFDGADVNPVSSLYMDEYFSAVPFTAIATITIRNVIKMKSSKFVKLIADCDNLLVLPEYTLVDSDNMTAVNVILPDAVRLHEEEERLKKGLKRKEREDDDDTEIEEEDVEELLPTSVASTMGTEYRAKRKRDKL